MEGIHLIADEAFGEFQTDELGLFLVDGQEEQGVLIQRSETEGDAVLAGIVARDLRQLGVAHPVESVRGLVHGSLGSVVSKMT